MIKLLVWWNRVAMSFAVSFWAAYVTTRLWAWFVVDQFDLRPLKFWNACGFALILGVYRLWPSQADLRAIRENLADKDDDEPWWKTHLEHAMLVLMYAVLLAILLGTGYGYMRVRQ